jgi:hypothetical protein
MQDNSYVTVANKPFENVAELKYKIITKPLPNK